METLLADALLKCGMETIGRLLMILGAVLAVLGALVWVAGRLGFKGLPGDLRYEGQHLSVYFPIATCLVLSALLTLAWWLWQWLSRR